MLSGVGSARLSVGAGDLALGSVISCSHGIACKNVLPPRATRILTRVMPSRIFTRVMPQGREALYGLTGCRVHYWAMGMMLGHHAVVSMLLALSCAVRTTGCPISQSCHCAPETKNCFL